MTSRLRLARHCEFLGRECNELHADRRSYQHKITGAKSGTRTEALGGILADDMGLGKSLSVLAAVAGTLNQADLHAQRVATMTKEQVIQGPIPARCTLVLVPSTCQCLVAILCDR